MNKDKVVSEIFETYDYGKFSPLVQNRGTANKKGIKPSKMKKLILLFKNKEWVPELGVIKVNKELKVIDGHHRLALLEDLKLPVWYQIVDHEKFNEVTNRQFLSNTFKTNQVRTDWTNKDFFKAAVQSKAPLAVRIDQVLRNNSHTFTYSDLLALLLRNPLGFTRLDSNLKCIETFEIKELIDHFDSPEFVLELESFILINNKVRIASARSKILNVVYEIIFNARTVIDPLRFRKTIPTISDVTLKLLKSQTKELILKTFISHYNKKTRNRIRVDTVMKEIGSYKDLLEIEEKEEKE